MGEVRSHQKKKKKPQFYFICVSFLNRAGSHGYDSKCCREQTANSSELLWSTHSRLGLGSRQNIGLHSGPWWLSSLKQRDIQLT